MKKLFLLILICGFYCSFAQPVKPSASNLKIQEPKLIAPQINIPDKINIVLPKEYYDKPKSDPYKDYLPAILTLLAGLISVIANWKLSNRLIKSTKENINKQLDESRTVKFTEIKSSINIKNRQEWMNQFRDATSEYISLISASMTNLSVNNKDVLELYKQINVTSVRLDLLLHPDREFEKEAIAYKNELLVALKIPSKDAATIQKMRDTHVTLIDISRKILEKNWQKLNKLEIVQLS